MKKDRLKGHLDLVLLGVLSDGPRHGYAVIAELRERTEGALELTEGAVYPALHRLEDVGQLSSEWQHVDGRRRRMYRITAAGSRALAVEHREWRTLVSTIDGLLRPRPVSMA